MNIPTCYRCPKRHNPDDPWYDRKPFCERLISKLTAVRGIGLTVIKFPCPERKSLFSPGDVVTFSLPVAYGPDGDCRTTPMEGTVMRISGRRWMVYSDSPGCHRKIVILYPDRLKKTGESRQICKHCALPIGVERPIMKSGEAWSCRSDWTDEGEEIQRPCEAAS